MIEVNREIIVQIGTFLHHQDTKAEFLKAFYALLPRIHKEPYCLNYELFVGKNARIVSVGRFKSSVGFNLHNNMQYVQDFKAKQLPILCERFEYEEYRNIVAPMSALSLLNE
jgi:quinol monooxygenase YgiN